MAVKNFLENTDIKAVPASPKPRAASFERSEIRTMQKDLELIRTHLPQAGGLISKLGPVIVSEPKPAPEPLKAKSLSKKPAVPEPAKVEFSTPLSQAKLEKIQKVNKKKIQIFEQRPHLSFVRVFFKAIFVIAFFLAFIAGVAYFWVTIRDTENLITSLTVPLKIPPSAPAPTPSATNTPQPVAPPAQVQTASSIFAADKKQEIVFSETPDAATIKAQLRAAQDSTLSSGEFLNIVLLGAEHQALPFKTVSQALALPMPQISCGAADLTNLCKDPVVSTTDMVFSDYALYVYGEGPARPFGAVFKYADDLPANITDRWDPSWLLELATFLKNQGILVKDVASTELNSVVYRDVTIKYLNFSNGGALDIIFLPDKRLVAVATTKESAFRLVDRLLTQ